MSYIGNQPTTVAFLTDQFSGTGSQTAFTLSAAPANTASIIVAVSGVLQDPSTYSVSGTTLTFSAAPPAGTGNISVRFLGIPASGVVNTAYRTQTEFTATAGQTTFSVPSYTVGYIDVYRNGALLGSADFTATNGTTVVLANPASSGDLVVTESFFVSSVLNAIPAVANAVTTSYINDGAVTTAKIADANVTQAKLAANVAGNGPAFAANKSIGAGTQSITSGVLTKCTFDTEVFDTNNNFASSTFTPTVAGYYQINTTIDAGANGGTVTRVIVCIYKNGAQYAFTGPFSVAASTEFAPSVSTVIYCNGSTDYIEVYVRVDGTSPIIYSGDKYTFISGALIRTA
jgi:hypothetical protein